MAKALEGKLAVITGAANGIGRAIALRLAVEGAAIAAIDIERKPLDDLIDELRTSGAEALPVELDLDERADVERAFRKVESEAGPIEILVNNVGQTARERISEFSKSEPEVWHFVIGVTLMSTLMCTRQVVSRMKERRSGRIVSISSDTAYYGDENLSDYAAAKAGVIGFTRSLSRELAPFGVNVNAVAPGPTRTRALERITPQHLEKLVAAVPKGQLGEPEDIANAVAFLSTDQSRFITGQVLVVNGGRVFC